MKLARCMECGKRGHFKCTDEKASGKVPINTHVFENLDEFFNIDKTSHMYEPEEEVAVTEK